MLEKNVDFAVYTRTTPNKDGYFGKYGGAYIPEQLVEEFSNIHWHIKKYVKVQSSLMS